MPPVVLKKQTQQLSNISDFIINAIVTSLDQDNFCVSPTSNVDLEELVGRKIQYVKGEHVYTGKVDHIEYPFLVIKFDEFPTGIGQGQIIEIYEPEDEQKA